MNKYDRRRKYYLVLDCETATLPIANEYENEVQKKRISIMKPLIYDLGWTVIDSKGNIYAKKNYLISEIFSVPSIFDTAYYKDKRNLYLDKLQKGEIVLTSWLTASRELIEDLQAVEGVGAYNSMFDYKKAIPFTDLYISMLYSPDFHNWLAYQEQICIWLADGGKPMNEDENKDFEPDIFRYKSCVYPLFDIWGLACSHLLDCAEYKHLCLQREWKTASGKYFITNAEKAYAFLSGETEFSEAHTAIDDCLIESAIFAEIVKRTKNKWEMGISYFPFRELGTVEAFCLQNNIDNPWGED